ncbi:tRNA dihydrouridine(20/20a) synthase DusA [Sodalis-like secondary symbiont of Drepanosiphum platanoidis]|uniref:tRNA dihydrouridine(20/20a) synthase DusA n=1 Tax=Sodalis-like secondary symbiont of Drepanosiphum platanoidis TaxID=2994493 RepID=UPI003463CD2B
MKNISKKNKNFWKNKLSIAPMKNITDSHFRFFIRKFSKKIQLYTEMINTNIILNNKKKYLKYNNEEHPIVLQLAGNDPLELAICSKIGLEKYKYDEINLNVGCPSIRANKGNFGICLMKDTDLLLRCIDYISKYVNIPITIKTRIGFDNYDNYEFLYNFIKKISYFSKCNHFIIHARKALIKKFSPKKNRNIPKLNYSMVYNIKKDFPNTKITINGGINNINDAIMHLSKVDGVMIGRSAYHNPKILIKADSILFNSKNPSINEKNIALSMLDYIEKKLINGEKLWNITRHMLNLFRGKKNAKYWRQYISKNSFKKNSGPEVIINALKLIK